MAKKKLYRPSVIVRHLQLCDTWSKVAMLYPDSASRAKNYIRAQVTCLPLNLYPGNVAGSVVAKGVG